MGLEIHAIEESGDDSMIRHFSIWNYRRCVALSGYMIDALSKEELEKEFRESADLQLYSEIKTDDDGNYVDPIGKLNDAEDEGFPVVVDVEKEKQDKQKTRFLYVNTMRDENDTPMGATVNVPSELFEGVPMEGIQVILTSMIKQTRGTEELLYRIFLHENRKRKVKDAKVLSRKMARMASETDDTVIKGSIARYIGMTLSRGMLRYIKDDMSKKERTYIEELFEQWKEVGSLASFNGVWLQIASEQKFRIK